MLSMILCGWNIVKVVTLSKNFTYMSKEMEAMVVRYSLCNMLASSHLYCPSVRVDSSVKKTKPPLHTGLRLWKKTGLILFGCLHIMKVVITRIVASQETMREVVCI